MILLLGILLSVGLDNCVFEFLATFLSNLTQLDNK